MQNGWVKKFADGSLEVGSDNDVRLKKASWTRGRLENMTGVELSYNGYLIILEGTGDFWQSDDMEAIFMGGVGSKVVKRRIQKKINEWDRYLFISQTNSHAYFSVESSPRHEEFGVTKKLDNAYRNAWLTIELDTGTRNVIYNFSEHKI